MTTLSHRIVTDGEVSLLEAIQAANDNISVDGSTAGSGTDEIVFDPSLTAGGPGAASIVSGSTHFEITEALEITGPGADLLTIDGRGLGRVFESGSGDFDVRLSGLTITGGLVTSDSTGKGGGGIFIRSTGVLTIANSTITGNRTTHRSGGGGAVYSNGSIVLTDSRVNDNRTEGNYANGGAVYTRGDLIVTRSTVTGNRTHGNGADGGSFSARGNIRLTDSSVTGSFVSGRSSEGGAIYGRGLVDVIRSTISGNGTSGDFGSGGSISALGEVVLDNSTVSGNRTYGENSHGGGVFADNGITIVGSNVSGNWTKRRSSEGGGVFTIGAVTVTSSTITGNRTEGTSSEGGGLYQNSSLFTTMTITNSIIAGNTVAEGSNNPDLKPYSLGQLTVKHSLIGDNSNTSLTAAPVGSPDSDGNLIGTADSLIDPLLAPLENNGGGTFTHALLPGSPAIDMGDPTANAGQGQTPEFDQRGAPFSRVVNGGSASRIDMGAYEFQTPDASLLTVTTTTDEWDYSNADISLREAVNAASGSSGPAVVSFDPALTASGPSSIQLVLGQIDAGGDITINGPGPALLTVDAGQQSRIFDVSTDRSLPTAVNLTVSGLTLTGGQVIGDNDRGGAVRFNSAGLLTISSSVVSGNTSLGTLGRGGAVYSTGMLDVIDSTIAGNRTAGTSAGGGGIYSLGPITVTRTVVSENVTEGAFAIGAGVFAFDAAVFEDATVSDNTAESARGGGIYAEDEITLTRSVVSSNTIQPNSRGGGVFAGGSVDLQDSSISGNVGGRGAGIYSLESVSSMGSTISGNSSLGFNAGGGGIYAHGDVSLTSSTVSGNTTIGGSSRGGGVFAGGTVDVKGSTIVGNSTSGSAADGGGIFQLDTTSNLPISVVNSIVAGNTIHPSRFGTDFLPDPGSLLTAVHNVIGDGSDTSLASAPLGSPDASGNLVGTPAQPIDALLDALADNGGLTLTHSLLSGSPAIDAGNNAAAAALPFDQRGQGFERITDGLGTGTPIVDIGAIESPPRPDIVAAAFNVLTDHVSNGVATVALTVENLGAVATGNFDAHIVWSQNDLIGDADDVTVPGSIETFSALAAGASESRTVEIPLPKDILYWSSLNADVGGQPVGTVSADVSFVFLVVDGFASRTDKLRDFDDITYFPWDVDHSGTVTPTDVLASMQAIGSGELLYDFDGNGIVTPLEVLAALQRTGYVRNETVFADDVSDKVATVKEDASGSPKVAAREKIDSKNPAAQQPIVLSRYASDLLTNDEDKSLFGNLIPAPADEQVIIISDDGEWEDVDAAFVNAVDWLSVL